ncbi:hypothetical protein IQ37_13350 [Chryseobacterium piperi]|uniref:Uncharacterized protein n=1 Tax=Chryseobacterium piperi TaxID=558152 RepID=A0A086B620_9FLAO|nr:hypothetical protein [Chryseobacterium piperi]ASW74466.1 hypothetical protein CJF12_09355 [Chryseobacterium piperi]KFF24384.1 hypothetical protein IQ37_13350 [Chryseobacterium piperi]
MKQLLLPFIIFCSTIIVSAQNINDQVQSLQLNTSPAYVVLGVEPENIQRPNSPTDFIAGVQSAIVNDKIQPNFAMETSPYYWSKNKRNSKKFNATEYLFSNNYGENLLKSITFSFATSSSDSLVFSKLKSGMALGIGMHVQLVQGAPSKNTKKKLYDWYQTNYLRLVLENLIIKLENDEEVDNIEEWFSEIKEAGSFKEVNESEKNIIISLLKEKLKKNEFIKSDLSSIRTMRDKLIAKSEKDLEAININFLLQEKVLCLS